MTGNRTHSSLFQISIKKASMEDDLSYKLLCSMSLALNIFTTEVRRYKEDLEKTFLFSTIYKFRFLFNTVPFILKAC